MNEFAHNRMPPTEPTELGKPGFGKSTGLMHLRLPGHVASFREDDYPELAALARGNEDTVLRFSDKTTQVLDLRGLDPAEQRSMEENTLRAILGKGELALSLFFRQPVESDNRALYLRTTGMQGIEVINDAEFYKRDTKPLAEIAMDHYRQAKLQYRDLFQPVI